MGHARTLLTLPEIKQVDFAMDIAKKRSFGSTDRGVSKKGKEPQGSSI